MWKPIARSGDEAWMPELWCGATLKLSDAFVEERSTECVHYPAQWVYFLWRPSRRPVPHRDPDGYGLTADNPADQMRKLTSDAPIHLVSDEECDWPALLDIVLACGGIEPWQTAVVREWIERKSAERRQRYVRRYGNDLREFERFMGQVRGSPMEPRALREPDFGLPSGPPVAERPYTPPAHQPHDCICMRWTAGYDDFERRGVGVDELRGRYGDVYIWTCLHCRRDWLYYFVEYESMSTGRWFRGLLSPESVGLVRADTAGAMFASMDWYFRGGGYFQSSGEKASGPAEIGP